MNGRSLTDLAGGIPFETQGLIRRAVKAAILNPLANYAPAGILKGMLRLAKSELAASNWQDPGGWRSMVISYDGRPRQIADKLLVGGGTMSMALRNRKRLASRIIASLIDSADNVPAHVLCLGAGPGQIIIEAMTEADRDAVATLVDLNSDAFAFGRDLAGRAGLAEKVRFIQSDVRQVGRFLDRSPDVVKMLGICEYLDDRHIVDIAGAAAEVMPSDAAIVFNSLSKAHGNDRFFRRVFGLRMIHRTAGQLQELMGRAGFGRFESVPEPLGVYRVIVGRKVACPTVA